MAAAYRRHTSSQGDANVMQMRVKAVYCLGRCTHFGHSFAQTMAVRRRRVCFCFRLKGKSCVAII